MLSSPLTWSSQPLETTTKPESIVLDTAKSDSIESTCDESVNDALQTSENVTVPETNHVIGLVKSTTEGVTNGAFLTVQSTPMGRSSRFPANPDMKY